MIASNHVKVIVCRSSARHELYFDCMRARKNENGKDPNYRCDFSHATFLKVETTRSLLRLFCRDFSFVFSGILSASTSFFLAVFTAPLLEDTFTLDFEDALTSLALTEEGLHFLSSVVANKTGFLGST